LNLSNEFDFALFVDRVMDPAIKNRRGERAKRRTRRTES